MLKIDVEGHDYEVIFNNPRTYMNLPVNKWLVAGFDELYGRHC